MKTTTKRFAALLTVGMLPMLCANAQVKVAVGNQVYVLTSTENANLTNATIQWYRNDVAIPTCTTPTCTVPANLCVGDNVRFYRKVTDNAVTVTFKGSAASAANSKCGGGLGTKIGSVCWADRNVNLAKTFTATPSDYGRFFQWNRSNGWASSGNVSRWNPIADSSAVWTVNPCPTGWRLPTRAEFNALVSTGSTWVVRGGRGNTTNGSFFGPKNATCTLPDNMSGCIFLSASGNRDSNSGVLDTQGGNGFYWGSAQYDVTYGYSLYFTHTGVSANSDYDKAGGLSVRCVQ